MTSEVRSTPHTTIPGPRQPPAGSVAEVVTPVLRAIVGGEPPVGIVFWNGSRAGAEAGPGTIRVTSPLALRRMLWAPGQLGIARQ